MCGRARCTLNPNQVARACGLTTDGGNFSAVRTIDSDRYRPSYNVSPGRYVPVAMVRRRKAAAMDTGETGLTGEEAEVGPTVHCMKWGLVPSFTKKTEKPDHFKMFNARSESIKEKASFRRLLPNNRCLVAVEGFYEWKKDGSKKQPYYIHFKDDRPLVFAALYDSWTSSEGEVLSTFTILTTRCSTSLEWLHDRMPVILGSRISIDTWLGNTTEKFESVLVPYENSDLVWYPVTTEIGKTSFDGPDCIKEIQLKPTVTNTISNFFTKRSGLNIRPEISEQKPTKNAKKDDSDNVKNEPSYESDKESKGFAQINDEFYKNEKIESKEQCYGIKRELEETEDLNNLVKQKERVGKNKGDGQASLLSYFGKK